MASKNIAVVDLSDGRQVLQSYGVTVAAFIPGRGYVRTENVFSVTTQRHINQYLGVTRPDRVTPRLEQVELLKLTSPISSKK